MRRFGRDTRLALAAAALLVSGMVGVLAFAGPASAAAALTVTPEHRPEQRLSRVASPAPASTPPITGAMLECNNDAESAHGLGCRHRAGTRGLHEPVCVKIVSTNASGDIPATNFTIATGDRLARRPLGRTRAGNDAATDAALYPCPPTAAQVTAGDTCVIAFGTQDGPQVSDTDLLLRRRRRHDHHDDQRRRYDHDDDQRRATTTTTTTTATHHDDHDHCRHDDDHDRALQRQEHNRGRAAEHDRHPGDLPERWHRGQGHRIGL